MKPHTTRTPHHAYRTPIKNLMGAIALPAMILLTGLALPALSLQVQAQSTGTDVSRYTSWTAEGVTFSGNSHGTASNPTAAVWSYYHQAGLNEDGTIPITELLPATSWSVTAYSSANSFFFRNDPGSRNRGRVEITSTALFTYWTVSSGNQPVNSFKPSWAITTYKEFAEDGGTYDLGGKLAWALGTTAPSQEIRITIAKISTSGGVSVLFNTTVSTSSKDTPITVFDQANGTLPATLTGITLAQGEQLAFAIRGSSDQFRNIQLIDKDLTLTLRPASTPGIPEPAHATLLLAGLGMLIFLAYRATSAARARRQQ
ncbi:hypothetical protein [Geminisphaera colitermitum]|uniref:hypothetical protein n=1 Tax=Geminisphaera colitermitum TaxID=1148786 RepID=UPI000158D3BF|nr:hypothetical protein [Geminisphaera colitermitum]